MKIKSVTSRKLDTPQDVYCMTVPTHHNFAVRGNSSKRESSSVFAHNCDADTD